MTDKMVQLKSGEDNLFPLTPWQGLKGIPKNTSYNLGDGMHFVAHRGNNAEWPENSIPAFEHVTRHFGIETDISVTKDGHWVIMHDATVDRMTNGTGNIADMTLAQIQALKIDSGNGLANCSDAELVVPTVDQYLAICKAHGRTAFLEIKSATYTNDNWNSLVASIKQYDMLQRMVIISFDINYLKAIKALLPSINVGYLVSSYTDAAVDDVAALGVNACLDTGAYASVTAANVAYAHSKNVRLGIWTPSDDAKRDDWKAMGIDYVTTNSLSGDLRYELLTLMNGWSDIGAASKVTRLPAAHVEEIAPGVAHVIGYVGGGTNTRNTVAAMLPDWAISLYTSWSQVMVRTSSGMAIGSSDVMGRGVLANKGEIRVGYGWDQMSTWVRIDLTYTI